MTGKELYNSCFCAMNWEQINEFVNAEFHLKSGAMHLVSIGDIEEYFDCYTLEDYAELENRQDEWENLFSRPFKIFKENSIVSFGIDSIEYIEFFGNVN